MISFIPNYAVATEEKEEEKPEIIYILPTVVVSAKKPPKSPIEITIDNIGKKDISFGDIGRKAELSSNPITPEISLNGGPQSVQAAQVNGIPIPNAITGFRSSFDEDFVNVYVQSAAPDVSLGYNLGSVIRAVTFVEKDNDSFSVNIGPFQKKVVANINPADGNWYIRSFFKQNSLSRILGIDMPKFNEAGLTAGWDDGTYSGELVANFINGNYQPGSGSFRGVGELKQESGLKFFSGKFGEKLGDFKKEVRLYHSNADLLIDAKDTNFKNLAQIKTEQSGTGFEIKATDVIGNKIGLGMHFEDAKQNTNIEDLEDASLYSGTTNPTLNENIKNLNGKGKSLSTFAYGQKPIALGKVILVPGARATMNFEKFDESAFSLDALLKATTSPTDYTTIMASLGYYNNFNYIPAISFHELVEIRQGLSPNSSLQLALGGTLNIKDMSELSLLLIAQDYNLHRGTEKVDADYLGAVLSSKTDLGKLELEGMLRVGTFSVGDFPSTADQTAVLVLRADYTFSNKVNIGGHFKASTGKPYTPLNSFIIPADLKEKIEESIESCPELLQDERIPEQARKIAEEICRSGVPDYVTWEGDPLSRRLKTNLEIGLRGAIDLGMIELNLETYFGKTQIGTTRKGPNLVPFEGPELLINPYITISF